MTSLIVEAYAMKMKAPQTHPWGMVKFMAFSSEYDLFMETLNFLGIM